MKKQTATISQLVDRLNFLKEEIGDVAVYVVHVSDDIHEGQHVTFNGLSAQAQVLQVVQNDMKGVLIFQSDEALKP